jgi:protein-S-isoprenylcysteine O-methyltransferase Ste14
MSRKIDRAAVGEPLMSDRTFASRGGWWVAGQFALLVMIVAAPNASSSRPDRRAAIRCVGASLLAAAAAILTVGALKLGKNLTPYPRPLEESSLVTTGIYRYVRHPLYFGVILAAFGIALIKTSPVVIVLTTALLALLNAKASREEAWLSEKFADYETYRRQSWKIIPFIL